MTTWTRDRTVRHCGQCGADIPADTVLLRITFGSCKAKKYRCAACAGPGPAPPDLPAAIEYADPPPIDLTRLGLLPLDFKRRQSGEEG